MVVHEAGHRPHGDADVALGTKHQEPILGHWRLQRRALGFPVGDQFVQGPGIDDRAGEDVRADL